jgi:hypothetical protein
MGTHTDSAEPADCGGLIFYCILPCNITVGEQKNSLEKNGERDDMSRVTPTFCFGHCSELKQQWLSLQAERRNAL